MKSIKASEVVVGDTILIIDNASYLTFIPNVFLRVSKVKVEQQEPERVVFFGTGTIIERNKDKEHSLKGVSTTSWWSVFKKNENKVVIKRITDQIAIIESMLAIKEIWE